MSEPRPCPFCGEHKDITTWQGVSILSTQECTAVYCAVCRTVGPHADNSEEAIEKWNHRPPEDQALSVLKAVEWSEDVRGESRCPMCHRDKAVGHYHCALGKAIGGKE